MRPIFFPLLFGFFTLSAQASANQYLPHSEFQVKDLCPVNVGADMNTYCFNDGTQVVLTYQVPCGKEIAQFQYDVFETKSKLHLYVRAKLNSPDPKAQCEGLDTVDYRINLPNLYGEVVIHDLPEQG